MATYFDGEKLDNVEKVLTAVAGGIDMYVTPADRYAKVKFNFISSGGQFNVTQTDGVTISFSVTGAANYGALLSNCLLYTSDAAVILLAGQKIVSVNAVTVDASSREFVSP